jgi:hypothetical protein
MVMAFEAPAGYVFPTGRPLVARLAAAATLRAGVTAVSLLDQLYAVTKRLDGVLKVIGRAVVGDDRLSGGGAATPRMRKAPLPIRPPC